MMAQLTSSQRQKIEEFKAVTNIQSDEIAQFALQKTGWNVMNCVSLYFENPNSFLDSNVIPNTDAHANANGSGSASQNENQNENRAISSPSAIEYYASYIPGLAPFISTMVGYLIPFFSYFSGFFSIFGASSSSSIPYQQILSEFKENCPAFGMNQNNIFENVRFGQLMNTDKCIFVYFNDAQSSQCQRFNERVLSDQSVIDYLRVNMKCWIGDKRNHDGRQLFAQITHQWTEKRKPFVVVAGIHPLSRKLVLVHRQYVGNCASPIMFISSILDHGLQRWEQFKLQQINKQHESQSATHLRQIQDMEYQQALQQQQQQRQQQHAEEAKQNVNENDEESQMDQTQNENEQSNNAQIIEERINKCKEKLQKVVEMCQNSAKTDLIKVAMRLPDGKRAEHTFCKRNTVGSLFDFANTFHLKMDDQYIGDFELVCSFPKKIFSQQMSSMTLGEIGIEHSMLLFVQAID